MYRRTQTATVVEAVRALTEHVLYFELACCSQSPVSGNSDDSWRRWVWSAFPRYIVMYWLYVVTVQSVLALSVVRGLFSSDAVFSWSFLISFFIHNVIALTSSALSPINRMVSHLSLPDNRYGLPSMQLSGNLWKTSLSYYLFLSNCTWIWPWGWIGLEFPCGNKK